MSDYSYMITNRNNPTATSYADIVPLSGNQTADLWWYQSPTPFDQNASDYQSLTTDPVATAPADFSKPLIEELSAQAQPMLVVYVHGLGNLWASAVKETAELGANLQQSAGFTGTVIGFSWPSYDILESGLYYSNGYAFPPTDTSGNIRGNINGSAKSFGSLLSFIQSMVSAVNGLKVSIVCHSEGNYMLLLGTYGATAKSVDQVLLLAADVNNAVLQTPSSGLAGQGAGIATSATQVTVYYTNNDITLASSDSGYGTLQEHNPVYGGRLGQTGPSYNTGSQQANSVSVDCSLVINYQNVDALEQAGTVPPGTSLHSSYIFIPQVLEDMAQTIGGTAAGSVTNRTSTANAGGYLMNLT